MRRGVVGRVAVDARETCDLAGWLFLTPEAVPEHWQERAVAVAFIPLFGHELDSVVARPGATVGKKRSSADPSLVALVAKGLTKQQLARELNVSIRTVDRRLAVLRAEFGAQTLPELTGMLARLGFVR